MSNQHTYLWEQEHLGAPAAYPTHPLVMACMVVDRYPSLAAACQVDPKSQFTNASRDDFLPGSGDAVHCGLDILRLLQQGQAELAWQHAERYWDVVEQNFPNRPEENPLGREQGERIRERLLKRMAVWETPQDPGSPYRVAS